MKVTPLIGLGVIGYLLYRYSNKSGVTPSTDSAIATSDPQPSVVHSTGYIEKGVTYQGTIPIINNTYGSIISPEQAVSINDPLRINPVRLNDGGIISQNVSDDPTHPMYVNYGNSYERQLGIQQDFLTALENPASGTHKLFSLLGQTASMEAKTTANIEALKAKLAVL
jgi:hypothetical protein